ncbi:MAG: OB-fold nucleic acid binding domain-containing protein [Patescibacteria group bacterium]|nr:OB-fold nucleic acid binding domain-containing protein [Patescibacteria group bacterium]
MERTYIRDLHEHIGENILVRGWISVRRDQGKMVFFDFRDMTGSVQGVVLPKSAAIEAAKSASRESVVSVSAEVKKRPEQNVNPEIQNGDIELVVEGLVVESEAAPPPFEIDDTSSVGEDTRLHYRYLDLRSPRMQRNIRMRSEFVRLCREFLFNEAFTEIETPLLTESTPEGSRDFVVPSRLHPGKFYALPQSPQQYKQLLMVAGFERYFQIARALRDEDLRADRGFEHSQIDIEMSFVEQEDVMQLVESMMTSVAEALGFTVKEKPFPRFTHEEALAKFGSDKFDLRTEDDKQKGVLSYAWVYQFPFFEKSEGGQWTFTHNPFSMPIPEHLDWLMKGENTEKILTAQYDLVCNGSEAAGGSVRAHKPEILEAVYKTMGYADTRIEESIGHMLEAFRFGAPPHGGIAIGIERCIMNLTGEQYLREVQAFPMTRGGQTAVMKAPKSLSAEQLKELGIGIEKKKRA